MFPITTKQGGTGLAMPDVCNTPAPPAPPVPMPYPCTIDLTQANPSTCAQKVTAAGGEIVTVNSTITMTSGMEAGSVGGLMSGMITGPARFTMGSNKVMIEGAAAAYQTCPLDGNGTSANSKGVHDQASQDKVLVSG
jgi:hypothetical protein